MRLIWTIALREFTHIRRDPKTLAMIIFMPLMLMIIYGYGINFDVKDIRLAVVDYDRTAASRDFIDSMTAGGYFVINSYPESIRELDRILDLREARVGVVIPPGFQRDLETGETAKAQFIIDGSDGNTAGIAYGYINALSNGYALEKMRARMISAGLQPPKVLPNLQVRSRFWYNPELKNSNFIIPGIIAVIMMIIGSVVTSLTLVEEKENGTFEQLIVSPIKPYQIILGKVAPYAILSFIALLLILVAARFLFDLDIKGSLPQLLMMATVYLIGVLGTGILVSALVDNSESAMLASMMMTLLPSILLSGFVFPIRNMPFVLQLLSHLVPARYFLRIMRGIYLKGIGIDILWGEVLFLVFFAVLVFGFAISRFKKRLD